MFCCQGCGKQALSYLTGGSINLYNPDGGQFSNSYQNSKCMCSETQQLHSKEFTLQIYLHSYKMANIKLIYCSIAVSSERLERIWYLSEGDWLNKLNEIFCNCKKNKETLLCSDMENSLRHVKWKEQVLNAVYSTQIFILQNRKSNILVLLFTFVFKISGRINKRLKTGVTLPLGLGTEHMNDQYGMEIFHRKLFILLDIFTMGVYYCSNFFFNIKQRTILTLLSNAFNSTHGLNAL